MGISYGREPRYADALASDIYARRGGSSFGDARRNVGWLTAKQTACLARNADVVRGAGNRQYIQGDLLNPDGDPCGVWEVAISHTSGAGMMNVQLFSELPK